MRALRDDFPILKGQINHQPLIYLDNAATMQMPLPVQDRMRKFYLEENANVHRGIHTLSERATESYEHARKTAAKFLHVEDPDEIIFTSGTTDAINIVAEMADQFLHPGDEILVTEMEHHGNYIPWMKLSERMNLHLKIVPVRENGQLNFEQFHEMVSEKTRFAAFTQLSNVTGIETPVAQMITYIRAHSPALVLVDGAQGIVHCPTDLSVLQPDFYCFSGHKLGGPTGTGVLYMKRKWMEQFAPVRFGGGTVRAVYKDRIELLQGPSVFEPGTPNYAGVIGLEAALQYWTEQEGHMSAEKVCMRILEQGLREIPEIHVLGETEDRKGSLSFCVDGMHAFDFCRFLDQYGIAARSGHHCAMIYLQALGTEHAVRFSVAPYNTTEEMKRVIEVCGQIIQLVKEPKKMGRKRRSSL